MVAIGKVGDDGGSQAQKPTSGNLDPKKVEQTLGTVVNVQKPQEKGTVV